MSVMLTNYHTHSEYCDGTATAGTMAEAARAAGFSILGFSSHAPLPFRTDWTMDIEALPSYLDTIRELAVSHAPAMRVLAGLEIDYIEGYCGPSDGRFKAAGLDYTIGSVHYVSPEGAPRPSVNSFDKNGEPTFGFGVDEGETDFTAHFERFYHGDGDSMMLDYWAALARCIRDGGFDILGHFDLVRKNNRNQSLFSEDSEDYRAAAMAAVDALAGSGIIVEINTGGMARGKTDSPYPALWILKELKARRVDICINADAHAPEHLLAHREAAVRLAKDAGYGTLTAIGPEGRFAIPLD
jgi:histidinol-phosphatase (PHP family)